MLFFILFTISKSLEWKDLLTPLSEITEGAAIISDGGILCAESGNWIATTSECVGISKEFNSTGQFNFISYGNKKYMVNQNQGNIIFAQQGKNCLRLQKIRSVIICVHLVEGNNITLVSERVSKIAQQFDESFT